MYQEANVFAQCMTALSYKIHSIPQVKLKEVLMQTFAQYIKEVPMQNLNCHISTAGYVSREQESICANSMRYSTIQF